MHYIISSLVFIASTTPIFGVLPPLYQSLNEYKELLSDSRLIEKLDSADLIQDIQLKENSFLIKTSKHILYVDVIYDRQERPGPAHFHFIFHDPEVLDAHL